MPKRMAAVSNVLVHTFGNETVVLNMSTEKYYTLNDMGTRMWDLLTAENSVDEVVVALEQEYDVDENTLRADVEGFVDTLLKWGLIEVSENETLEH